jgi:prepilin-type N-terminal cleavage/methylation domain-containing protein
MRSERSSPTSRPERSRGFSLLELLMAVGLAGIALTSVVQFFALQTRKMKGHTYRVEAQQAARTSLDAIARDVRLAGACLPITGAYVPLTGTNGPGADSITVRTGIVRANLSCIVSGLTALMAQGTSTATVDSANGFSAGMLAYLRHPSGSGQFMFVTATGANTISLDSVASVDYPIGSGLYAIDERTYAVDTTSVPTIPQLTLVINRGAPEPFAAGVQDLQIRYVLNRNCPPCDVVDAPLPADTVTWRLVNSVNLTATVQTIGTVRAEDAVTMVQTSSAKPRNLLP